VLLKFKYFVKFLQQHSPEVFPEVRQAYVETLSRIYRSALCASPCPLLSDQSDAHHFHSQVRHRAQPAAGGRCHPARSARCVHAVRACLPRAALTPALVPQARRSPGTTRTARATGAAPPRSRSEVRPAAMPPCRH
jgi:hypothetical protein